MSRHPVVLGLLLAGTLVHAQTRKPSKHIHEDVDPYTHLRALYLGDIKTITCPDDPSPIPHEARVQVVLAAFERAGGQVDYYFSTDLSYGNSLNVRQKGTLDVLADGRVGLLFSGAGSTVVTAYESNHGPSYLHETIPFEATRADLQSLTTINLLRFRINGSRQSIQRCVEAKQFRDVDEFLSVAAEYGRRPPS